MESILRKELVAKESYGLCLPLEPRWGNTLRKTHPEEQREPEGSTIE